MTEVLKCEVELRLGKVLKRKFELRTEIFKGKFELRIEEF